MNGQKASRSACVSTRPSGAGQRDRDVELVRRVPVLRERPRVDHEAAPAVAHDDPVGHLQAVPRRADALPVARRDGEQAARREHAGHRRERRAAGGAPRRVDERVADAQDGLERGRPTARPGRSSHAHTSAATSAPRSAASARVRPIIPGLASVAVTARPCSASPTASCPVPAAQSSTRAPRASPPVTVANAAAAPSGDRSGSGTSQS